MGERCRAPEVYDSSDEHSRDDRIECYYQVWGAREMAERIVELEDELGADVDGMCTGMHADVAEARAEVERLQAVVRDYEHRINWFTTCAQCARLMDAVYDETLRVDRYRLAYLSARRRAARESVMSTAAVEHLTADRDRWRAGHERAEAQLVRERRENERLRADLEASRKTTHATPRLEYAGDDEDGPVFKLAGTSCPPNQTSGAPRPITEV